MTRLLRCGLPDLYNINAGWDIGGAHVKLAFVDEAKLNVHQWDCPLWKGINELESVLQMAITLLPDSIARHHVTMTGELVDIFSSHHEGVDAIINTFIDIIGSQVNSWFYSSEGLLTCEHAINNSTEVASANWIASAHAVSEQADNTVFIDMGSTTTDILHIDDKGLVLNGMTDYERLITGELVYTGVVRSCVNTICQKIPYRNNMVPLMAEFFSSAADVYRILGWLPNHADYGMTMDGGAKDRISSMRRLARMIGKDYDSQDDQEWKKVGEYIAEQQLLMVEKNVSPLLQINQQIKTIIGAGVGRFLIKKLAERLHLNYVDFSQCIIPPTITYDDRASECAPAVALVFMDAVK